MVERERDNDDNDEYVYYFITEIEPARRQGWNGGWGCVVGRLGGRWGLTLYFIFIV